MPLVEPLPADQDAEIAELADLFNVTLGFPPNSVLTMMPRPRRPQRAISAATSGKWASMRERKNPAAHRSAVSI
jgi:hypothetical protein